MDRVGAVFLCCMAIAVVCSLLIKQDSDGAHAKTVALADVNFNTTISYNILAIGIIAILTAFYTTWM